MVSAVAQVLTWSTNRPLWQRDALRRIATSGLLTGGDIEELASLAQHEAIENVNEPWVSGSRFQATLTAQPLGAEHLPTSNASAPAVHLLELGDLCDVNAIAANSTLTFGVQGLTIVSGWNGTGKSGYARVVARACRARVPDEPILGNVTDKSNGTGAPRGTIRYLLGDERREVPWREGTACEDEHLARVSFFDSRVALAHVAKRVDVRYTPAGLDLLASLADACQQVQEVLKRRQQSLRNVLASWPQIHAPSITKALDSLGTAQGPAEVRRLAALSESELEDLRTLDARIAELSTTDPARRAAEAGLHAEQLIRLAGVLRDVDRILGPSPLGHIIELATSIRELNTAIAAASVGQFTDDPLPGVGTDTWRALWEAARTHSTETAYLEQPFPQVEGARCVLCQQPLDPDAAERMRRYAQFVSSDLDAQRQQRVKELDSIIMALHAIPIDGQHTAAGEQLIGLRDPELHRSVSAALLQARALVTRITDPDTRYDLADTQEREAMSSGALADAVAAIAASERSEETRLAALDSSAEAIARLRVRQQELAARKSLADNLDAILGEHDRLLDDKAVGRAIRSCTTTPITVMSSLLSSTGVKAVCQAFAVELGRLGLHAVEVVLVPDGGTRGVSYVRVGVPNTGADTAPRILSEGERRVVALAGFLAELTVSGDQSAIVLDDPVSSMDHRYRQAVAERLVDEATRRQAIILTHDTTFVNDLYNAIDEHSLRQQIQESLKPIHVTERHIIRTSAGTGVISNEPNGRNPKVAHRLDALDTEIRTASRLYEAGDEQAYEQAAMAILVSLRKAWERAVEEWLLAGVVERHNSVVQTKKIRYLHSIPDAELAAAEFGMAVESRFAHDSLVGNETPIRSPQWLRDEVRSLRDWVTSVKKRHKAVDRGSS